MSLNIPVLDNRSYDQLVAEVKARIAVHTPEWTNLNASDPGITLLELFAFLTDNLLYRSNRIPEANRLKFLSMLGIPLQPATPGLGLVTVTNAKGPIEAGPVLPAGTELRAGQVAFATATTLPVLPVTAQAYIKRPHTPDAESRQRYETVYQTFLETDTTMLSYYAPVRLEEPVTGKPDAVVDLVDSEHGTIDRCLWLALLAPNADLAAVRAAIANQTLSIGVYPAARIDGRALITPTMNSDTIDPGLLVEIAEPDPSPLAGEGFGIGPARYRRLEQSYAEPVLEAPGVIQVKLPPFEKLLVWAFDPAEEGAGDYPPRLDDPEVSSRLVTWLRLRYPTDPHAASEAEAEPSPEHAADDGKDGCCCCGDGFDLLGSPEPSTRLTWVGVNAVRVAQAVQVTDEQLGLGTGTPFQVFTMANSPIIVDVEHPFLVEVRDDTGKDPDTWVRWQEVDDIFAAGRDEQVYRLDRATGRVTFGSGLAGVRVPRGAFVRVTYWYGGGLQGTQPIGAINSSAALPGGFTVTNPLPTWGAGAGESVADGEAAISSWLRHRDRLVTATDFADLTRRTPGVDLGRVEVLPLFHPEADPTQRVPGVVTLMVVPRSDPLNQQSPTPDRLFLNAVCAWLEPRRLITTELHVRGPEYVKVWVSVGVVPVPGQVPAVVEQAVAAAVRNFLSPLTGGLEGNGWPLSLTLRTQDVEAIATRVPGVRYVHSVLMAAALPSSGGATVVVSPLPSVALTGLQLPDATVLVSTGEAQDPRAQAQPIPLTLVSVPVVPATC